MYSISHLLNDVLYRIDKIDFQDMCQVSSQRMKGLDMMRLMRRDGPNKLTRFLELVRDASMTKERLIHHIGVEFSKEVNDALMSMML
jgi:hypothetical protein